MRIHIQGVKPAKCYAARKYWGCSYCKSVFFIEDEDCPNVEWEDDQREGEWITMHCPVCECPRSMTQGEATRIINERSKSSGVHWDR